MPCQISSGCCCRAVSQRAKCVSRRSAVGCKVGMTAGARDSWRGCNNISAHNAHWIGGATRRVSKHLQSANSDKRRTKPLCRQQQGCQTGVQRTGQARRRGDCEREIICAVRWDHEVRLSRNRGRVVESRVGVRLGLRTRIVAEVSSRNSSHAILSSMINSDPAARTPPSVQSCRRLALLHGD